MTFTSDERREVAARLRKNADKRGVSLDYLGSTQVASWWLLLHTIGCNSNEQESVFRMLADLIDPTCHIEDDDWASQQCMGPMLSCDRCGNAFPEINGPYQYCPCCGARVVDEDD